MLRKRLMTSIDVHNMSRDQLLLGMDLATVQYEKEFGVVVKFLKDEDANVAEKEHNPPIPLVSAQMNTSWDG